MAIDLNLYKVFYVADKFYIYPIPLLVNQLRHMKENNKSKMSCLFFKSCYLIEKEVKNKFNYFHPSFLNFNF